MEQNTALVHAKIANSSNIASATFNPASQELIITFTNGKGYTYLNVSDYHGKLFCESPLEGSHGKHFAKAIRDRYDTINHDTAVQSEAIKTPFPDEEIRQAWATYEFQNSTLTQVKPEQDASND